MTRHTQEINSDNCLQVCLASIFDVPTWTAPHVFANAGPNYEWTDRRWEQLAHWSKARGSTALWLDPEASEHRRRIRILERSGAYYIGIGRAVAGDGHAVVMRRGELSHDPAGGMGIVGNPWTYIAFEKRKSRSWFWWLLVLAIAFLALSDPRSNEIAQAWPPLAHHPSPAPRASRRKATRSIKPRKSHVVIPGGYAP
jgi:hypothetical protein